MKTTYKLAALVVGVVLAGCDQSGQSYSKTPNDTAAPEVAKEAREGLSAPKPYVAEKRTENKDDPSSTEVKPDLKPGQDIVQPGVVENRYPATPLIPELKKEIKETVVETKDQFVMATEEKMKDLDGKIAALGEKIEALNADSYAKDALSAIHDKREHLGQKFDELKASSQEMWRDLKTGFDSTMDDLMRAYDDARAKYDK